MKVDSPKNKSTPKCSSALLTTKSGIYALATLGLVLIGGSVISSCILFKDFINRRGEVFEIDPTVFITSDFEDDGTKTLVQWTSLACRFFLTWIAIEIIIFLSSVLLFYGAYKNNSGMLKRYLSINTPYFVMYTINVLIFTSYFDTKRNFLLFGILIFDLCRLIMVRSTYKSMVTKERFLKSVDESNNNTPEVINSFERYELPPHYEIRSRNENNPKHCHTCSCTQVSTIPERVTTPERCTEIALQSSTNENVQSNSYPITQDGDIGKPLDINEKAVIYDQTQLRTCNSSVIENDEGWEIVDIRSNIVQDRNFEFENSKDIKNFDDLPVIFDQNQFYAATSPIFEESPANLQNADSASNVFNTNVNNTTSFKAPDITLEIDENPVLYYRNYAEESIYVNTFNSRRLATIHEIDTNNIDENTHSRVYKKHVHRKRNLHKSKNKAGCYSNARPNKLAIDKHVTYEIYNDNRNLIFDDEYEEKFDVNSEFDDEIPDFSDNINVWDVNRYDNTDATYSTKF